MFCIGYVYSNLKCHQFPLPSLTTNKQAATTITASNRLVEHISLLKTLPQPPIKSLAMLCIQIAYTSSIVVAYIVADVCCSHHQQQQQQSNKKECEIFFLQFASKPIQKPHGDDEDADGYCILNRPETEPNRTEPAYENHVLFVIQF